MSQSNDSQEQGNQQNQEEEDSSLEEEDSSLEGEIIKIPYDGYDQEFVIDMILPVKNSDEVSFHLWSDYTGKSLLITKDYSEPEIYNQLFKIYLEYKE